jgi:uncharacterized protein
MKKDSLRLEHIKSGARIFVDSTVFIYHFTGSSVECKDFLSRCERMDLKGITSVIVLAEVAHRMMMLEALTKGLIHGSNPAKKLRAKPDVVKKLHIYQQQTEQIPLMGIEITTLDLKTFFEASVLRDKYGFLTYDSLIAAIAAEQNVEGIASADPDFDRLEDIPLFCPSDVRSE